MGLAVEEDNMKKTKGMILLLVVCVAATACALAACNEKQRLNTPENVRITESDYLVWDEVSGADGYMVAANGKKYYTDTPSLDLLDITVEYVNYRFSVFALCESDRAKDSVPTKPLVYKPEYPDDIFEYTRLDSKKDVGYVVSLKAGLSAENLPEKLIVPSVTPDGDSVVAVTGLSNAETRCVWIPNSVSQIGSETFKGSANLARVHLPDHLKTVPEKAFSGCAKLSEISLPGEITTVYGNAFNGCSSLKEIVLPKTLINLAVNSDGAFVGCDSLGKIVVEQVPVKDEGENSSETDGAGNADGSSTGDGSSSGDSSDSGSTETKERPKEETNGNGYYYVEKGCLMSKSRMLIKALGGFEFPDDVTIIGYYALDGRKELTNVVLPNTVSTICGGAFSDCVNLESIELNDYLNSIVTNGNPVFKNCKKLKSLEIPAYVGSIDGNLFAGCDSLTRVSVDPANANYRDENNFIIRGTEVVCGLKATDFPSSVTSIGNYAYAYSTITEANIPSRITIGNSAFAYCLNLKKVTLGSGTQSVPDYAFLYCCNLETLDLPEETKTFGMGSFFGALKLSVVLPRNVNRIDSMAFYGATVYTDADQSKGWVSSGNIAFNGWAFLGCSFGSENGKTYVNTFVYNNEKNNATLKAFGSDSTNGAYRAVPVRDGYEFSGWATEAGGAVVYAPFDCSLDVDGMTPYKATLTAEEVAGLKNGTTLYAVWTKK